MMDDVSRVLVEVLDVQGVRIDDTTNLRNDLGLNNQNEGAVRQRIADEFGADIDDEDWYGIITAGDLVKFLQTPASEP